MAKRVAPTAILTGPTTGQVGQALTFIPSGRACTGGHLTAGSILWGDGLSTTWSGLPLPVAHVYNTAATYMPVLTLQNSKCSAATSTLTVVISAATGPVTPPPSAPTGLSATAGDQVVNLSWSTSAGAATYTAKRATVSGGPYTNIINGPATSTQDGGLTNGTPYYYVVTATSAYGTSSASSQVSATPSGAAPPPPPPPPPSSGALVAADFTYIGSFRLTHASLAFAGMGMGWNPAGNSGSGSLLIAGNTTNYNNIVVEMIPATPTISPTRTQADLPNATYVQTITDVTGGLLAAAAGADGCWLRGITGITLPNGQHKIAWGFSKYFNANNDQVYGLGYCDLNGSNVKGGWILSGLLTKKVAPNLSTVPQAWADLYTGGRAIIGGGLDYQIIGSSAGGHAAFFWAPWVDDPVTYAPAANSTLTVRTGADYPMGEYANPSGQQMAYPSGVVSAGFKPAGFNYFWTRDSHGGVQYVTTSDGRSGFVVPGTIGGLFSSYDLSGNYYTTAQNSNPGFFPAGTWAEGTHLFYVPVGVTTAHGPVNGTYRCGVFFYDPAAYLAVMAGGAASSVTAYDWKNIYPDLSLNGTVGVSDGGLSQSFTNWPNNNWNWNGDWRINGSAYDPLTRRLYLLHEQFYSNGSESYPGVHVYQVS